jgi:DNA-binding GntR family transcriptional regulator
VQKIERPQSLTELAYAELRNGILSGELAAGMRLSVVSLAAEMGMSRSPVRAAIERLATDGLMRLTPGGAMINAPDKSDLLDALAVRATLEGLAARLATSELSRADIAALEEIHDQFRVEAGRDYTTAARKADLEFHQRIQLRCGNSCLVEHLNRVQARVILATYSTAWSTDQHQAVAEHSAILSALRSGDAEAAGRAATTHLDNLATRIRAE